MDDPDDRCLASRPASRQTANAVREPDWVRCRPVNVCLGHGEDRYIRRIPVKLADPAVFVEKETRSILTGAKPAKSSQLQNHRASKKKTWPFLLSIRGKKCDSGEHSSMARGLHLSPDGRRTAGFNWRVWAEFRDVFISLLGRSDFGARPFEPAEQGL